MIQGVAVFPPNPTDMHVGKGPSPGPDSQRGLSPSFPTKPCRLCLKAIQLCHKYPRLILIPASNPLKRLKSLQVPRAACPKRALRMSLGLEKRNIIKQGKPFVQFLVMSFARDKWDKIAELTSCTRSIATKTLEDWTWMHGVGFL